MIEQDEVLRMALEAGFFTNGNDVLYCKDYDGVCTEELERFAVLAFAAGAAHEREACAKTCEEEAEEWSGRTEPHEAVVRCAAAIRGRGMDLLTQHSQSIGEYDER